MSRPPLPQHCPSARELDDLELLSVGAMAPTLGFNEPGSPVTLALPDERADEVAAGGAVELVDPEGLPLATVTGGGSVWSVTPLTHAQYGPFRRLYLRPEDVRARYAGRTFVTVTDAMTEEQVAQLRGLGDVALLALVGRGTPSLSPVGLLRATLRVADLVAAAGPAVDVVAVPLATHGDPAADATLRAQVVANYAGPDPVVDLAPGGTPSVEVADIVRADRPAPDEQGLVIFFTGLSGSGKSTLAQALMDRLLERGGRSLTSLDGDVVRRNLSAGLTFSKEDRETNIRRIGWVAAEISRHGGVAVCSPIAPFDATRQQVRQYVAEAGGAFFLVHVATPLEECERRDRKGLYAKARRGEIPEFTGISSPYEEPQDADVRVDTTGRTIDEALDDVIVALRDAGYLDLVDDAAPNAGRAGPTPAGVEMRAAPTPGAESAGAVSNGSRAGSAHLSVLFVCTANICRSPYMELRAGALLLPGGPATIELASAGTHGFRNRGVDETMAAVLRDRGLGDDRIGAFSSRPLTRELVEAADLVLTAESSHRAFVLEEVPGAFRKVFTLGQFADTVARVDAAVVGPDLVAYAGHRRATADPKHEVSDPFGRGRAAANRAADQIDGLLRVVMPRLTGSGRIIR
ncbi:adenylyl-sulfate kinase [Nocardioides bizhenqiangii]|uniref:Adenylyl-sulfate kinase n=1 Tax=Nocardioides bizhenqiangii TaxID=3095076 RepID=A0ABZ0ZNM3_9ACTN|nr:adenylyl-sulfate kinase [Nocardioides sp. HM61]WQQ25915.1 adenylyl-sulfate kinase [Nocardioides sp. HM61]